VSGWRPLDCHSHSTWSDGALAPDVVCETVQARGVRPSITDHVSREVTRAVHSVSRAEQYVSAISEHPYRGVEFCSHDALWRELPDTWHRRLTHRLGSLHAVALPDGSLVRMSSTHGLPDGLTIEAYMRLHVASIEALVAVMPIEIFAHPTLVPRVLRSIPGEELWQDAYEARVIAALRAQGIVFEVSNRYRPHERFVKRAVDAGVRLSLGSDGHTAAHVGDVAWPLALTARLGVPPQELYDPLEHGTRHG
jgi:histidinol phosphatase-like PHP family hydrolase